MRWISLAFLVCCLAPSSTRADDPPRPNFVIIFADDLGYGDLSCYGHPTLRTPRLDRMAAEGMRFTQFYVAAEVCTPSRAGLLTGRLPIRSGMCDNYRRVLFPNSGGGLPASEVTLAEALHEVGYACGCFGKWHLGHLPQFLPTNNGFDAYFGLPYSNDMDRTPDSPKGNAVFQHPRNEYWNVPLMRDEQIIERPADQASLTRRYTDEAIAFIRAHKDGPFFAYVPHSMPHVPLFASEQSAGTSRRGLYGDVVEEIDASVGRVLDALEEEHLTDRTLVFFTSDNGPWLIFGDQGGSAGLLKDGKGSTWEGGMREPGIARWPGHIPAGVVTDQLATSMDLFTTFIRLAGGTVPADRVIDGLDLSPLLLGTGKSPREDVFYYRGARLMAVRHGPWKAHFATQAGFGPGSQTPVEHDPPALYQLEIDPSERNDVHDAHPEVLAEIDEIVRRHKAELVAPPSQLGIPLPGSGT